MAGLAHMGVYAVTVWVLSFSLTLASLAYAMRVALIDLPGDRRSHAIPTPRGGGAGIVLAVLVAVAWLALTTGSQGWLAWFAMAVLGVAAVGWWDDHRPLSVRLRLAVHLVASLVLGVGILGVPDTPAEGGVFALAVLSSMALVNFWNFMDGINGLAASQAALLGLAVAVALPGSAVGSLGLALGAACLGFLPWNLPRARVFMGDVGSGTLGLMVAAILWRGGVGDGLDWRLALILPSAMLVDAGLTLAMRVLQGKRWWTAHREHLYQRAVGHGLSHALVTFLYACWSATLACAYLIGGWWGAAWAGDVLVFIAYAGGGLLWAGARLLLWRGSHGVNG